MGIFQEKKRIYDGRIDDGPEFKSDINGMRWRNTELLSDRAWNARAQSSDRFDRVPFKIKGKGKRKGRIFAFLKLYYYAFLPIHNLKLEYFFYYYYGTGVIYLK
ncbi:hypothetical protein TNIN_484051 [Trichonephila inaurata madagascariensis]|uniref:Uncharacterized protein n=1 Tax=Trichonephila inaurata madagascariensis TaxID=2747483 RepID=A0A8X7CEX8_9ARAC|nr:hypothetical protein TNIN_484051 [Trichonephila inaurata madagascariensis]